MTRKLIQGSAIGATALAAACLAGCATTPSYPTDASGHPATVTKPAYPTTSAPPGSQAAAAGAPAAAVAHEAPAAGSDAESGTMSGAGQAAPPPAEVQSAPLPPVSGAPAADAAAQPEPSQPPAMAPTPQAAPPPVPQAAYVPPPAYRAPAPALRVATGRVVKPHGMYRDYVVQRHDDLDAIARDLDTTTDDLIEANHLRHPGQIKAGQHLKVPVEKAYVVAPGDTIYAVARRFSVAPAELAELNDLPLSTRLRSGDQLALPNGIHDRGPLEAPAPTPSRYAGSSYRSPLLPPPPQRMAAEDQSTPRGGILTPQGSVAPTPGLAGGAATYSPPPAMAMASRPPPNLSPIPAPSSPAVSMSDAQIVAMAHNRFIWPVRGAIVSRFGTQAPGVKNDGVDLGSPAGTPVQAAAPGEVVYAGNLIQGFGNLVLLRHSDGWVTAYAHLAHINVQMRQSVAQGQEIGQVGQTGGVTAPELHFEVRYAPSAGEKARPIDPLLVLPPQTGAQG